MRKPTRRKLAPLIPSQLYTHCDPALLAFGSTDELEDPLEAVGQARATEAIRFGADIARDGYNIFVLGSGGSGRYALLRRELDSKARTLPHPADWVYVNNFAQPSEPRALRLPAGRGAQFQEHMHRFTEELGSAIPAAFTGAAYKSRLYALDREFRQREESTLTEVEKQRLNQTGQQFEEYLRNVTNQFPSWRREHQAKIRELRRATLALAAGHLLEELRAHYGDLPEILAFLDAVEADLMENYDELREPASTGTPGGVATLTPLQRYRVNLLTERDGTHGAPVIFENHPSCRNLTGEIGQLTHRGTLLSNFGLIKAGALHRANGGFLIIDAGELLDQAGAWEELKRALLSREIRIEPADDVAGPAATLSPQPIPLDVKVALYGERMFYYLLLELDPDFAGLFRVTADFEDEMERSPENTLLYARMIAALLRRHGLRALDSGAVARAIEHSARLAENSVKLLTHVRSLKNLLIEADHFAAAAQRNVVRAEDIQRAITAQISRVDRLRRQQFSDILDGTVLIDTDGLHAGQVNGLGVVDMGDFVYAHPIRITATARLGEGNVIDIEREVELGGAIHSKGVLILTAFLAARYSHNVPLSLNASLVFEQSYSAVEGDSASLAELCALLSALSGLPVFQELAVTGSVNQFGQVQAISAVNEKVEGYFDVCRARGLTGKQGVLIPAANVRHLMLRHDVVEAAEAGQFHIYAVADVDQAIELLTGIAAGNPDAEGHVPEGSVNYLVAAQLIQLSQMRKDYADESSGGTKTPKRSRTRKKPGGHPR